MKTIAIIMARGGSKGLPGKNIKKLNGIPLICYSINDALNSGVCDDVIVTTDDDEIAKISINCGAKIPFKRPSHLADDFTPPEPVIQHALVEYEKIVKYKFDIVVYLQPTDIFRPKNIIKDCVNKLKSDSKLDTVFSGYKTHKHFWQKDEKGVFKRLTEADYSARQTRVDKSLYREDQGIACAFKANLIREKGVRVGENVEIIANEEIQTAIDIHDLNDFELAKNVILKNGSSKEKKLDESTENNFLGNDLKSWSQGIRNGYVRAHLLFALHETKIFEELKNSEYTAEELAAKCKVNSVLLTGILNFLHHADKIVEKKNDKFSLTEFGKEYLFTDAVLTMSFGAVGAYSCILTELVPSLRNEKKYGVDYIRPGDLIAKGSFYTGRKNYPWVVENLKKFEVKKVADLGCGSVDVLINLCQANQSLKGVGIDISEEALNEAKKRVKEVGLENQISLSYGDLYNPETYAAAVQDVDAFNAIMVMHEFLRDGKEAVIEMFKKMKKSFPGKYFFIGEFDSLEDEEFQSLPYPDRIHYLFYQYIIHPLTWQGLGYKEDWLDIFEKSNCQLIKMEDKLNFRLVQFIIRF